MVPQCVREACAFGALARTTPALFGLFSLVCLIALHLSDSISLQPNQAINLSDTIPELILSISA